MSTFSASASVSAKPASTPPEIDASDLQAARDFLLDGAPEPVAPRPERERPRRPTVAPGAGRTVVRNGISLARIRSSVKTGN